MKSDVIWRLYTTAYTTAKCGGLFGIAAALFCSCGEESVVTENDAATPVSPAFVAFEGDVSYNVHVRPILSDKCFLCHGPDETHNGAGVRLDNAEAAFTAIKDSNGRHPIVAGDLKKSVVWEVMNETDKDRIMPPPESNLVLTPEEKSIIAKWIEQGAVYEDHWAFVSLPDEIAVPDAPHGDWVRNSIDHFVSRKLAAEGLDPSPEASPLRWLRRTTLSLTGLPPTPEEIAAFEKAVAANGEAAYEATVDDLLARPAFGQHMAIDWLDAARYADSFGYHSDSVFTPWPYRDWVVESLNADMPFDEFVTWNLAGDLMPGASQKQVLATAYNRLHRITNEGGSSYLEFFVDGVADRIQTVGTSMMGLTMECARCHDHKYDPILAKDYFSMFAFFNSINESGVYNHGNISPPPSLLLPTEKQQQRMAELKAELVSIGQQRKAASRLQTDAFAAWKATAPSEIVFADQVGHFTFDDGGGKAGLTNQFASPERPDIEDEEKRAEAEATVVATIAAPKFVPGKIGQAIQLDGDSEFRFPHFFETERHDAMSISLWISQDEHDPLVQSLVNRLFGHDVGYNGWEMTIEDGHLEARVFRAWPDNGIGVRSLAKVPAGKWSHITWTYDGSGSASGLQLYLDGERLETEVTGDQLYKSTMIKTYRDGVIMIGAKFRGRGFVNGRVDDARFFRRDISPLEVRKLAQNDASLADASDPELEEYYLSAIDADSRASAKMAQEVYAAITAEEDGYLEVPVMKELPEARPAYILARGEFNAPRTEDVRIERDTPHFLPPFPEGAPRNRLGFAQWLTDPDHPLLSRVHVNRIWALFFGNGLVGTAENFGLQGDLPTHPELLDWLARDFIAQGWSHKKLVRQIVLSSTYRQQSAATPELLERDIDNKLLARGPGYRMSGEELRDLALAASGLLDEKSGGSPSRPYDPLHNKEPKLDQVHSRSLYSFWRRTKPLPNMTAFDKPSLEVCSVKRTRTNSPAQTLVLLNDTQFVEAARALATSMVGETDEAKIRNAWLRSTGDHATNRELAILLSILEEQRAYFKAEPERAEKLLAVGLQPLGDVVDTVEAAALTVTAQAILNADATVWKR